MNKIKPKPKRKTRRKPTYCKGMKEPEAQVPHMTAKQRQERDICLNCNIPQCCCTGDLKTCGNEYEKYKMRIAAGRPYKTANKQEF